MNFDRNTGAGMCTASHEDDKGAFTDANSVNSAFEKVRTLNFIKYFMTATQLNIAV